MKKFNLLLVIVSFLLIVGSLNIISAAQPLRYYNGTFFEGFESGNFNTFNITSGVWAMTATSHTGSWAIISEPKGTLSTIQSNISTINYVNISFSFWSYTVGLDAGEYVSAEWYNGTAWITALPQTQTIAAYTKYSYNLTSDAANNPDFLIRFNCSASSSGEWCYIDDVNVTGIPISCNPPPNFDWVITTNVICNNVNRDIGAGSINITTGTLTVINHANITARKLNILNTGDKVFINRFTTINLHS